MVIIGLGNPGKEYANTPHNVGFMAVDALAESLKITFKLSSKHQALIAKGEIDGETIYILKPLTYMNLSGNAVRSFIDYYKIDIDDLIVIYDDMDLELGIKRIRKFGSSGGHNGMKSIISSLGTTCFKRIRIGIGRPKEQNTIDHVLHTLNKAEKESLDVVINQIPEMIESLFKKGFDYMMNTYNGK